jgi:hypothetical protein
MQPPQFMFSTANVTEQGGGVSVLFSVCAAISSA